jgi:putative ABC transport system permease protein
MIRFLLKGLSRDPNRSIFPVLVVTGGVMITVLFYCWVLGVIGDVIKTSAVMDTGHVKVMTRAYRDIAGQAPNDLAVFGASKMMAGLARDYPDMDWTARIKFGGLLDFPDEYGETRVQGPAFGMGIDLLSPDSTEVSRLHLENALVQGRLPEKPGEILISEQFAQQLGVEIGETSTLISATASGGMAIHNFILAGTIRFGIGAMDKGAMLADITDIQYALDMADAAGEIFGYFQDMNFDAQRAAHTAERFNAGVLNTGDEFSPVMLTLKDQNGLGEYIDMISVWMSLFLFCFICVMGIVLWNTGLMSGIRRYGEIGIRLAIGESKGRVYRSMIYEAVLIGISGSVFGTILGIAISYYLQEVGIDASGMLKGATIMMPEVMRARIALPAFFIGFIPGVPATVLGALVSGINIFRRETSQLFKELET